MVADILSRPSLEPAVGPQGQEVSGGHSPGPVVASKCLQTSLEPAEGPRGREAGPVEEEALAFFRNPAASWPASAGMDSQTGQQSTNPWISVPCALT